MKQIMIDMMGAMMPFMKMPMWAGAGLGIVGAILLVLRFTKGSSTGLGFVGWALVAIGGFFVVCQVMGAYLGMGPTINFGDPKKFEFNTVEFWKIGLVFLAPGALLLFLRSREA